MTNFDVVVIGGGPAGLAAAIAAKNEGASVLLIEREVRLGGILKQCIHDGFGLIRFGEKLSGPEYAQHYVNSFHSLDIPAMLLTFVTAAKRVVGGFELTVVSKRGLTRLSAKALVLATGCRERTAKQVAIHGTRPAGVLTAGAAQHMVNLLGQMPTKRCVILGSGDIGLIMARRLTLEGAEVQGVYEAKSTPSGLTRNLQQCLYDFNIPLHLSHTVTRVFGQERLTSVEICQVDERMQPIAGTEQHIECDGLILSVGLIPENELAEKLNVSIDPKTKGAICTSALMSNVDGIFVCGNALHVSDLVDYVSESGETAGKAAAHFNGKAPETVSVQVGDGLLYLVPQQLCLTGENPILYFRSRKDMGKSVFTMWVDDQAVLQKEYNCLRPPEMERLVPELSELKLTKNSLVRVELEECI